MGGEKSEFQAYLVRGLDPEYIEYIRKADPLASEKEAERLFERAIRECGDLSWGNVSCKGHREWTIADLARSELYDLRYLAVGKVAPEITGEDIDGKPLKLSEFRGKIVVLTFWSTGCAPCMRLVSHERTLVQHLAGKPFVLLGINGDDDREQARNVVQPRGSPGVRGPTEARRVPSPTSGMSIAGPQSTSSTRMA